MTEGSKPSKSLLDFFKRLTKLSGRKLFKRLKSSRTVAELSASYESSLCSMVESRLFIGTLQSTLKKKWESCTKAEQGIFNNVAEEINNTVAKADDSDLRINE